MRQVDLKRDPISSKVTQGWPQGGPKGPQDGSTMAERIPRRGQESQNGANVETHETKQMEMLAFRNRYTTVCV